MSWQVLLCTDLWKDQQVLHAAYCDSQGVTQQFILNGMKNAVLAVTGGRVQIDIQAWQYDVVVNPIKRQVCMHFSSLRTLIDRIDDMVFQGFERGARRSHSSPQRCLVLPQ